MSWEEINLAQGKMVGASEKGPIAMKTVAGVSSLSNDTRGVPEIMCLTPQIQEGITLPGGHYITGGETHWSATVECRDLEIWWLEIEPV